MFSGHYTPTPTPQITFFSSPHGTFSRTDHILGHKTNFNKFKSIETISSIFSDRNGLKLEINHKKRKDKKAPLNNNMLLKKQRINKEIKKYLGTNENQNAYKIYEMQQKQFLEGNS